MAKIKISVALDILSILPSSGVDAITHCRRANWVDARRNCWRRAIESSRAEYECRVDYA
jgi:hypothetical protein